MLLTTALIVCCALARAQTEKYIQSLTGDIKKGDSCVVSDDKFPDAEKWRTVEEHLSVNNLITFELRYDTTAHYLDRNFSCTLQVNIEYEDAGRAKQSIKNVSLEIGYDTAKGKTYQGIAYYKFNGGHHVNVTVNKISSAQWGNKIPPVFRIRNEIIIERLYKLDTIIPVKTVIVYKSAGQTSSKKTTITGGNSGNRADVAGQQETISWDGSLPCISPI